MTEDMINPSHYKMAGGVEVIDIIRAVQSDEEYYGYLWGNVIKYTLRHKRKGMQTDLEKARWYLNELIDMYEQMGE